MTASTIQITQEMLDNVFPANIHTLVRELNKLEREEEDIAIELAEVETNLIAKWGVK